jgi:hypothetical protein
VTPPDEEGPPDAALEALWARALQDWGNAACHAALVEYALQAGKLPDLAGRYRPLKNDPEKGERANKQLDAIVLAATQMMLAMKTPRVTKPPPGMTFSVAGICAVVLAWLAYAMWRMLYRR